MRSLLIALVVLALVPTPVQSQTAKYVFAHYSVSTSNPAAQEAFDQGLTFVYAFNRQAAEAAFRRAAGIDPHLAIAWWGVALSRGPNINISMTKDDMATAVEAIAKAKALESEASPEERALIEALTLRYAIGGDQDKLATPYANAMDKLAAANPDDPDVEALYLESRLDALSFNFPTSRAAAWDSLGRRATADVDRWPTHIGMLHYFIHITEPNESAFAVHVADTLASDAFAPQASHLRHMPSHVYVHVGEWAKVMHLNDDAVHMDIAQAKEAGIQPSRLDYFFHNLYFWYGAAVMSGDENAAEQAIDVWAPFNADMRWVVQVRFNHVQEAMRLIDQTKASQHLGKMSLSALLAYGLACSQASQTVQAQSALTAIQHLKQSNAADLAADTLSASIAQQSGDAQKARELYLKASYLMDKTDFEEAPPWSFYPRELLAELDLRAGDAAGAAEIAQADLYHHPNAVPVLQLLQIADERLGKATDVQRISQELQQLQATR